MKFLITVVVFIPLFVSGESLKILGVFGHPGRSHFYVFQPLLEALSKKGHGVTVLSYFPLEKKLPRYTDIVLKQSEGILEAIFEIDHIRSSRDEKYFGAHFIDHFGKLSCESNLPSNEFQELLHTEQKFDVIISEYFNSNCLLIPLVERFKIPFIGITSHVLIPWTNAWVGNPDNPAYISQSFMDFSDNIPFLGRVENTLAWIYNALYYKYIIESAEYEFFKRYIGEHASHPSQIIYNTSLVLAYTHFSMNRPRSLVPNVVEIGGMHVGQAKTLPMVVKNLYKYTVHKLV